MSKNKRREERHCCCNCLFYVPHWEPLVTPTPRPGNESRVDGTFIKLRCGHCDNGSRKLRDAQHEGCRGYIGRLA